MIERKIPLMAMHSDLAQPFRYAVGRYGSRFLTALRDEGKILGIRCPQCGRVYVPPRQVCGPCFQKMEEFVELNGQGTIENFTVVLFSFIDPETGTQRPVPYGYALIRMDGAYSRFIHFLEETDMKKIRVGMRVEPVLEEKRTGSLKDIKYFRIIEK